ncbi:MAG: ABC transporter permease [Candidatus Micrarchaeaceae archaeon]|jgi:ABC-2 type transport system permease protein
MGLLNDTMTLYKREMLIFKANLRTNLIRSIMFPLIILLIFGSLGSSVKGVPVDVVNYASNPISVQFINTLQQQNVIAVKGITTETQALNDLSTGKVDVVVVILPGFPASSSESTPSLYVYYSNNYVNLGSSLQQIGSAAAIYGARSNVALQQGFVLGNNGVPPQSTISLNPTYGAQGNYSTFLAGGIIGMVVVFGTMFGGGMSIITDRQLGNLKAFLITPVERTSLVLSKMLSGTTQALISGIMLIGIIYLFGIQIAMGAVGVLWILLLSAVAAFGFSGITTTLASRVNKIEVYAIAAQTITMPLWFASGAFSPTSALPSWLQPLSVVDPLTYMTVGIRDIMINGYYPLATMGLDFAILIGFAIVATIISIKVFSTRVG